MRTGYLVISTYDVTLYDLVLENGLASGVSARNVRRFCIESVGFRNFSAEGLICSSPYWHR